VGLHMFKTLVAGKEEHMSWGFKETQKEVMSKSKVTVVVVKVSLAMMLLGIARFMKGQHSLPC